MSEGAAAECELVAIPTGTAALDGLYYPPAPAGRTAARPGAAELPGAAAQPTGAALLMHGNGHNFYTGPARFLPPHLTRLGLACLSYNRRGHDTISCRTREPEGNAFQTVAQAIADNEYARGFLAGRGYRRPVVIGHSNGGLLAAAHVASHPDTPALVLLSAHCGGPEMLARASAQGLLGGSDLPGLSRRAHDLVAAGRGDELMLMPGWWYVTSAASFADTERNLLRLLELARRIHCPVLVLRGEQEDPDLYPAERFGEITGADVRIIPGADHFYTGLEDKVAGLVAGWLAAHNG